MADGPPDILAKAMPGTVTELAATTGWPPGQVLRWIERMRADGWRVNAMRDINIANVPAKAQPEADAITTIFFIDPTQHMEVE